MNFWWLSFCDSAREPGEQFLGVAIVETEGQDIASAVATAWKQGCNPGGDALVVGVPAEQVARLPHGVLFDRDRALAIAQTGIDPEEVVAES